jgi:Bromodomain extra-terminal - transcription regulation/Bromodomain
MQDLSDDTEDEENQNTILMNDDEEKSEEEEEIDIEISSSKNAKCIVSKDLKSRNFGEIMIGNSGGDNTLDNPSSEKTIKKETTTEMSKFNPSSNQESSHKTDTTTNELKTGNGTNGSINNVNANISNVSDTANTAPPPPPVLKGTLSFNVETRRHMIRGMWNYENSSTFPPQRFELLRNLERDEDPATIPIDGEFHGSFSLAYFHTTSKGKQKERSKVIPESGVKIKFTKIEGSDGEFAVDGEGTNQFGIFNINGKATPSEHEGDPTFDIVLRKRYKPSHVPTSDAVVTGDKKKKKKKALNLGSDVTPNFDASVEPDTGPLPPPSESFPSRVVCLRGKLAQDVTDDFGSNEGIYRIVGMWSSGLDLILADPQNVRGLCNRFEYEHKSSQATNTFPVSGRYSGWFDLSSDDGTKTRINEKDVTLKFRRNNCGYHNVEGKGSNAFGKYSISGTLTQDNVITIFRHFQLPKKKVKDLSGKPVSSGAAIPVEPTRSSKEVIPPPEMNLKLDDVETPQGQVDSVNVAAIPPPASGTYSAVSRGIMRINDDGAHTCSGKWAMTREHFNNGSVSAFAFRLESHYASQGAAEMKKANSDDLDEDASSLLSLSDAPPGLLTFPVDSAFYKGSFQMKRGATKYTSVIDQQIVLRFRKNAEGSFNVYGKGVNSIGLFTLMGKLILSGKSSGHVELYRMYPLPTAPQQQPIPVPVPTKVPSIPSLPTPLPPTNGNVEKPTQTLSATPISIPEMPRPGLQRRESSRLVKVPSRLEDDDPDAQMNRLLEKCSQILKLIREKDIASGAFFAAPVDPVALGLPTYYQVISEPMDLGTIQNKMDGDEIESSEEFGRLVRLVFENAMTFNVEPTHIVHQSARQLLILFNQKFRDIERMFENIRRQHKLPESVVKSDTSGGKALAKGKKRKGVPDEMLSLKKRRLEEAQSMAADFAHAMNALTASAPSGGILGESVSRSEFNAMVRVIQKLQGKVVQTYTLLAEMSSDAIEEPPVLPPVIQSVAVSTPIEVSSFVHQQVEDSLPPVNEKKKAATKRKEPSPSDDEKPLTFDEQQAITETINNLPPDKLPGVIRIIRESANFGDDEEEIDLEIDQLDTVTQRKLQRFIMKVSLVSFLFLRG